MVRISARMPSLASDLTLRTDATASPTVASTAASPPAGSASRVGQDWRCREPSPNHDHTSSVAYGMNGASRRSRVSSASLGVALAAVGAVLDELEVVVAERPEERLGDLEGAGVVPSLEPVRRLVDDVAERCEHRQVERVG